ncbi:uncharacterized protein LOC128437818 isoform X2 [Pleuronectes platessa]|uniref:uncharacterized protein LOC128437818 isoform X2 n=1 Tax=Pleuronectes platessa TaxID=8262 RepID=UPI00232A68B6|nr:uncharacterized protein LOC128437818 isoform X2 [Pleuronectes platessa]
MFEDLLSVCLHSLPSLYQSLSVESPLVCKITCNQHQHRPKQPLPNRQVENIHCLYGDIILKTQASPVFTDDDVTLCYQHQSGKHKQTSFFKNGALIDSNSSSGSDRVIKMTLKNVTREDEGFYRCASHDRQLQSPESWLSVRPDRGSWKWIIASCGVLLLIVIPLTVWLVCHYRYQKFCTWSCWPVSKQEVPAGVLPATKLDVTEVQWDLSWMEMSNLLEKDSYCGT